MINGPAVGPALVLNLLMRWPSMIVVCALAAPAAIIYDEMEVEKAVTEFKSLATSFGIIKAEQAVKIVKDTNIIPVAVAAKVPTQEPIVPIPPALEVAMVETPASPPANLEQPRQLEPLSRLERVELETRRIAHVLLLATN